jgi:hypothetical protein
MASRSSEHRSARGRGAFWPWAGLCAGPLACASFAPEQQGQFATLDASTNSDGRGPESAPSRDGAATEADAAETPVSAPPPCAGEPWCLCATDAYGWRVVDVDAHGEDLYFSTYSSVGWMAGVISYETTSCGFVAEVQENSWNAERTPPGTYSTEDSYQITGIPPSPSSSFLGTTLYFRRAGTSVRTPIRGGSSSGLSIRLLASDADRLYWLEEDDSALGERHRVVSMPLGGSGDDEVITTLVEEGPQGLDWRVARSDGTHLFWCDTQGTMRRMPVEGGAETLVLEGQDVRQFELHGDDLFLWTPSSVLRLPKAGGSPDIVADGPPDAVDLPEQMAYFVDAEAGTVTRVPLGGGPASTVTPTGFAPAPPAAVGDDAVYVAASDFSSSVFAILKW